MTLRTRDDEVVAFLEQLATQDQAEQGGPLASNAAYRGAEIDRLNKAWLPAHRSGDEALLGSWPLLTARVRDLIRNEPSLGNAKRALVKHIIRTGIQTFAEAIDAGGESIDDFNFESDEQFERWCEEEADAEGRQSWQEMQWSAHDEVIETGDCFFLKCMNDEPGRTAPLSYQHLEAEQLDDTQDRPAEGGRNKIVRGVELDGRNRPVAYWVYDAHPHDSHSGWSTKSTRIPAERVLHYYVPFRPSMTRGISWFHALLRVTRDADWYLGNELTSAALAALLVMIHKTQFPQTGGMGLVGDDPNASSNDAAGNPMVKWGRGIKATIPVGDDIELAESKRPSREAGPFIKLIRQEQSMGAGISYLRLTGDFSQTSFTSAHGAANEDTAYILPLQMRFGRRVCAPVRREWTRQAVAYGSLLTVTATQFQAQPRRWSRLTIQPPGREQLDPVKQTEASVARIRSGMSTLKDECGLEGKNWRRNILQRKREEDFARAHGVELDFSKGASEPKRNQVDNGAEVQPEED